MKQRTRVPTPVQPERHMMPSVRTSYEVRRSGPAGPVMQQDGTSCQSVLSATPHAMPAERTLFSAHTRVEARRSRPSRTTWVTTNRSTGSLEAAMGSYCGG